MSLIYNLVIATMSSFQLFYSLSWALHVWSKWPIINWERQSNKMRFELPHYLKVLIVATMELWAQIMLIYGKSDLQGLFKNIRRAWLLNSSTLYRYCGRLHCILHILLSCVRFHYLCTISSKIFIWWSITIPNVILLFGVLTNSVKTWWTLIVSSCMHSCYSLVQLISAYVTTRAQDPIILSREHILP